MTDRQNMLSELTDKIQSGNKALVRLRELETELDNRSTRLMRLERGLKQAFVDLQKLDEASLKGVFHGLLGDKEEQRQRQQQLYQQKSEEYNRVLKELKLLEYEFDLLSEITTNLELDKQRYERLIADREKEIIENGDQNGRILAEKVMQIDELTIRINRIQKAIHFGKQVQSQMAVMLRNLDKLKSWSHWDINSSRFATDFIMQALGRVRKDALTINEELRNFYEAIEKVNMEIKMKDHLLEIRRIDKMSDLFYDSYYSDMILYRGIKGFTRNVKEVRQKVVELGTELLDEEENSKEKREEMINQKASMIVEFSQSSSNNLSD